MSFISGKFGDYDPLSKNFEQSSENLIRNENFFIVR
jgi:hypothetical protein